MTDIRCHHCFDTVPQSRICLDNEQQFCCHGCEIAFSIINSHNADDFYRLREQSRSDNATHLHVDHEKVDSSFASEAFSQQYIRQLDNGLHAITWYVQGAHCAACVWLLERLHLFNPAIITSRLHIGNQQLITYYDPQQCTATDIVSILASLGYRLMPWHSPQRKQQQIAEQRHLYMRFAVACASMIGCMHVSWNILAGEFSQDLDPASQSYLALLAGILSIPAIFYSAFPWYRSAWQSIKKMRFNLDASISSILLTGTALSFWHLILGRSDIYFDAMAMFVCFLLGGRLVLYLAQQRVGEEQDALKQLLPLFAHKRSDTAHTHNDTYTSILLDDIRIDDQLKIEAGQRCPVDGIVLDDYALVDNALLSGEQMPIELMHQAQIYAGARVLEEDCHIQATSLCHNSRIAGIMSQDTQQSADGARTADISERILQWFTPLLIVLGFITWFLWMHYAPERAWDQAIAVFIVACPCALGIASPLAYSMFIHRAAQHGILMSNPRCLQKLPSIRHIVFDKTGTLSDNTLQLQSLHILNNMDDIFENIIPHLLNACRQSQHPVAHALIQHYSHIQADTTRQKVHFIQQGFTYQTVHGTLRMQKSQQSYNDDEGCNGCNHSDIFLDDTRIAQCVFSDQLRLTLRPFLDYLRSRNYQLSICSGDLRANSIRSGEKLGFSAEQCHGDCSPEDKQKYIRELQKSGTVLMIGDGLNDALALDQADISIGVRGGLEAAMQHSDIYISHSLEKGLPYIWHQARQHRHCLLCCLIVSLLYNVVGVAAAMLGYWGPFICALAMPLSSISIIIIAWNWPRTYKEGIQP